MFKLTYKQYGTQLVIYFDDIKSIGQALINIVNDEKEENAAMKWCGNAHIGDSIVRQKYKYKIECFSKEALKKYIENSVLKPIKDRIYDIGFEFIGWDNDALIWDIDLKANTKNISFIKFHDNYGYNLCINEDKDGEGGYEEIASVTDKDKAKFIRRATDTILQAKSLMRHTKSNNSNKVETDARTYTIVPCAGSKLGNIKQLDVIVTSKKSSYRRKVTVTLMPDNQLDANKTGLGNAPKELYEKLMKQFKSM